MDFVPAQKVGLFSSNEATQDFLRDFCLTKALSEDEKSILCSLFPSGSDFAALSLVGVMERVTTCDPPLSSSVIEHLWRALRDHSDPELQASTYDSGIAFGRFVLTRVLYSRPKVLVIFHAIDKQAVLAEEVVVKIGLEEERIEMLRNEQDLLTGALFGCEGVPEIVQAGAVSLPASSIASYAWAIVMKPFGVSLWDVQEQKFPLMSETARRSMLLSWACRLPVILQDIHERGIVHCDIKPDNIIVTSSGALTIIDFDLATSIIEAESRTTNMGTEEFGPLAIWRDGKASSEETDFISLVYTIQALEEGVLAWLENNRSRPAFERTEPRHGSAASIAFSLYLQFKAKNSFLPSPFSSSISDRVELNASHTSAPSLSHPICTPRSMPITLSQRRSASSLVDFILEPDLLKQGRKRTREGSKDIILLDALDLPDEPIEENDLKRRHSGRLPTSRTPELLEIKQSNSVLSDFDVVRTLEQYVLDRATVWRQWHPDVIAEELLPSYDESSASTTLDDTALLAAHSSVVVSDQTPAVLNAAEGIQKQESCAAPIAKTEEQSQQMLPFADKSCTSANSSAAVAQVSFAKPILFSVAFFGMLTVSLWYTKWHRFRK